MPCSRLEQSLLSVYRLALRQGQWRVAEHVLAALEAGGSPSPLASEAVVEAYSALANACKPLARASRTTRR
jgi:hypothetical protein